jgi:hypothetical protein
MLSGLSVPAGGRLSDGEAASTESGRLAVRRENGGLAGEETANRITGTPIIPEFAFVIKRTPVESSEPVDGKGLEENGANRWHCRAKRDTDRARVRFLPIAEAFTPLARRVSQRSGVNTGKIVGCEENRRRSVPLNAVPF